MSHPATPVLDDLERQARRNASAKLGWIIHAAVFLAVNLLLAAVSAASGRPWALFPAAGWALGLAIHGAVVFVGTSNLRRRMVQQERQRLQAQRDPW